MEKKENYDPELEAFCRLIDREQQRFQLLEERKSANSARQLPSNSLTEKKIPNNSMAWQFELEDFKMPTEDARIVEPSTGRSDHQQGELKGGESLLPGTKRMRELTPPVSTAAKKKNKTIDRARLVRIDASRSMLSALYQPNAVLRRLCLCHSPLPRIAPVSASSLSSSRGGAMEGGCSPTVLVLSCKSPLEDEFARSLKSSRREGLKLNDEEVRVSLHSEEEHLTFNPSSYMDALTASRFGRLLIWSPRIPSTHDLVSKNFEELPVGTVCLADVQSKGRGRAKNVWESPAGCLLFSFTVQMQDGRKLPLLQYVVSLAVTEAIKELCQAKGLPHLNARIKWPNDLYLNGLKVGGILCTSTYRSKMFNVCAGIGLNLDNESPTTCLNAVLRKINSASHRLSREDVLASFFNKFENLFDIFSNQGFQPLEELYYNTWLHSGQKVVIEEKQEGKLEENITVTVKGLTSTGYLLATDDDNKSYELHPDGNSFDFFKGLVRRKLE